MIYKEAYIRKIGPNKFRVFSEKGKNMGTYRSMSAAKERLRKIEYFKHQNAAEDNYSLPRGGVGDVPEFFRRNLDYGERADSLNKKLKKLKAVESSLDKSGLVKEASQIKNLAKDLFFKAIAVAAGFGLAISTINTSLESGKLKEIRDEIVTEEGLNPNLLEQRNFPEGITFSEMLRELYPSENLSGKEDTFFDIFKQLNDHIIVNQDNQVMIADNYKNSYENTIGINYPKLDRVRAKLHKFLPSGYYAEEKIPLSEIKPSEDAIGSIVKSEGFMSKVYSDKPGLSWPEDKKKGMGHWTIGYGHLLTKKEIETGFIELDDGSKIHYNSGITEDQASKIRSEDFIKNKYISEDPTFLIERSIYDAIVDIAYNIGGSNAREFLSKIKNEDGTISKEKFREELWNWKGIKDPSHEKGILLRRTSQLLTGLGIFLPDLPEEAVRETYDLDDLRFSNAKLVSKYIDYVLERKASKEEIKNIFRDATNPEIPLNSHVDFISIIKSYK